MWSLSMGRWGCCKQALALVVVLSVRAVLLVLLRRRNKNSSNLA